MKNFESLPKSITESVRLNTNTLGYKKFFFECVNNRIIIESILADSASSALGRIATKTLSELSREDKADPVRFNALVTFANKIDTIADQIRQQHGIETDENAKYNLFDTYSKYKFLADPSKDAILKRALNAAKNTQGNRLAVFIQNIIGGVTAKNSPSPIASFKEQILRLKSEIEKFYNPAYPYQASIKGYHEFLLGPNGLMSILEAIMDEISASSADIEKAINPGQSTFGNKILSDVSGDYQTSHKYESAILEAFSTSLSYFLEKYENPILEAFS